MRKLFNKTLVSNKVNSKCKVRQYIAGINSLKSDYNDEPEVLRQKNQHDKPPIGNRTHETIPTLNYQFVARQPVNCKNQFKKRIFTFKLILLFEINFYFCPYEKNKNENSGYHT